MSENKNSEKSLSGKDDKAESGYVLIELGDSSVSESSSDTLSSFLAIIPHSVYVKHDTNTQKHHSLCTSIR